MPGRLQQSQQSIINLMQNTCGFRSQLQLPVGVAINAQPMCATIPLSKMRRGYQRNEQKRRSGAHSRVRVFDEEMLQPGVEALEHPGVGELAPGDG